MNSRTKEFIVAIQNHKIVYGNTNINAFIYGMRVINSSFPNRETLKKHLDDNNFYFFINSAGLVYEIYRYKNPNYKKASGVLSTNKLKKEGKK